MDQKELRTIVKKAFKQCYEEEAELVELKDNENSIEFAIVDNVDGHIATFLVGTSGIFDASSNGNLLSYRASVRQWLDFLLTIDHEVTNNA